MASVSIADFVMGIQEKPDQFDTLENLLKDLIAQRPQTITSPRELAQRMAGEANLIKDVLGNTLREDESLQTELAAQYHAFKENLIHDTTAQDFADIYAETIAYGMFAARLHDTTLDTFSRQEALELLPKSNPSRAGQPERAGVAHLTHMAITSPPIRTHAGERRCLVRLSIAELPTYTGRRGRSARAYRAT